VRQNNSEQHFCTKKSTYLKNQEIKWIISYDINYGYYTTIDEKKQAVLLYSQPAY